MKNPSKLVFHAILALGAVAAGCEQKKTPPQAEPASSSSAAATAATSAAPEAEAKIDRSLLVQFGKLPSTYLSPAAAAAPATKEQIELGRMLFWEKRLTKNQDRSCNTCHNLETFGVDNEKTSEGHKKQRGSRNSPTVYNAAGHFVQFWDGRAKDVEEQAKGPILNPVEMGMKDDAAVLKVLQSIPQYTEAFKKAFPGDKSVSFDNLAKAIGAFERTLVTPSRFDKYVAGDESALNAAEKKGLAKFLDLNCPSCHTGALLGGNEFKKLGQAKPWEDMKDLGRYEVTKAETDKQVFKTPSLRNIAKTAPYFHDGSVATLENAVKLMAKHQLGKTVSDDEAKSVATFLGSLTGEPTAEMTRKPDLPPNGPTTPKPDPN